MLDTVLSMMVVVVGGGKNVLDICLAFTTPTSSLKKVQ